MSEKKKVKKIRKGMGVFTIKQANTIKGKPAKAGSRVVREKALMTNAYADSINDNYEATGKYCEEDKDATAEYNKASKSEK